MSRYIRLILDEVLAIARDLTPLGTQRLAQLQKSDDEWISTVASLTILKLIFEEPVQIEDFLLLIEQSDLD